MLPVIHSCICKVSYVFKIYTKIFISVINQLDEQKFYASSWLITEINIVKCTVSKTSKYTPVLKVLQISDLDSQKPTADI